MDEHKKFFTLYGKILVINYYLQDFQRKVTNNFVSVFENRHGHE